MAIAFQLILMLFEYLKISMIIYNFTDFSFRKGYGLKLLVGIATIGQSFVEYYYPGMMPVRFALYIIFALVFFDDKWYRVLIIALWAFISISSIDSMVGGALSILLVNNEIYKLIVSIITLMVIGGYGLISRKIIGMRRAYDMLYYALFTGVAFADGVIMSLYLESLNRLYMNDIPIRFAAVAIFALICFLIEMFVVFLIGAMANNYKERIIFKDEMIIAQQTQFELLEQKEETTRGFRHDIMDHMCVLRELLKNEGNEAGLNYINSAVATLNMHNSLSINNHAVDAILNYYLSIAKEKQIECKIDGMLPAQMDIEMFDLCTVYANIMKNAINAVGNVDSNRMITVLTSNDDNNIYILEKNNYSGTIKINNGLPTSSKKDASMHGYGIRNVNETIKKYGGNIVFNIKPDYFEVSIILPYKGKGKSK